jgi:Fe-S cluster assembly protein SufD
MTSSFTADASRALDGPEWLAQRRERAFERLAEVEWPSPAEEIWRYSRIDELDLDRYRPVPFTELGRPGDERVPGGGPVAAEAGEHAGLIVVRDGRVVHHDLDESLAAKGVSVCGLATCEATAVGEFLGRASAESEDAFTVLHDAFLAGGAFVHVPDGVVVDRPIVVLHWCDGEGLASFPHTLVVAGRDSEVTVLDRFTSPTVGHLVDGVVELLLDDAARVRYLSYARLRSEALLAGAGAECDQLAVYFGDDEQMLDFRTLQDHDAPSTRSDLLFKGAVEDHSRSVYSGLVHLRPAAQRAVAHQTNRNLVLTEGAGAESIPNLEIEANDVRCSHASAVGPIDDDQRYYLESRGVPPEEAERLIVLGFFEDVFTRLPVPSLVDTLRRSVHEKVGHLHA